MTTKNHILPALALCALFALGACGHRPAGEYRNAPDAAFGPRYSPEDTWAVYWYICGGDLETGQPKADGSGYEKGGKATDDLLEMLGVRLPENVTVVIEMGGTKNWQTPDVAADANSLYVYDSEGFRLVERLPQAAMSDEKTVANFLRFCNESYPADHRGVLFWDHGGGSVKGIIFDELSGRSLRLPGIRAAFEAACTPSVEDPPYEFVGIDACLMATVDVAETLHGIARWMIASEEFEPGCGWDYGFMQALADDPGMGGGQVGKAICDAFYAGCVRAGVEPDVTLSLVNLSRIGPLLEAYEKVGAELFAKACEDYRRFGALERAAMKAENYGGNNEWDGYINMVDLGDLTRKAEAAGLLERYHTELYDALEDCVAYQVKGRMMAGASGLSCYYSYNGDRNEFDRFAAMRGDHSFRWLYHYRLYYEVPEHGMAYMRAIGEKYGLGPFEAAPIDALDAQLGDAPIRMMTEGGREVAELAISSEEAAGLACVHVNLVRLGVNGGGTVTYGTAYLVRDDWGEAGVTYDAFTGYWAAIDGAYLYLEIRESPDHDALYHVPALLNGERCTLDVGYFYETGAYEIEGARHVLSESGMAPKDTRRLAPGDVIEPLCLFDSGEGAYEWAPTGRVVYTEETRVESVKLPEGMYFLAFTMEDMRGNEYTSNAVKVVMDRR